MQWQRIFKIAQPVIISFEVNNACILTKFMVFVTYILHAKYILNNSILHEVQTCCDFKYD